MREALWVLQSAGETGSSGRTRASTAAGVGSTDAEGWRAVLEQEHAKVEAAAAEITVLRDALATAEAKAEAVCRPV